jgi:hypothetical protein
MKAAMAAASKFLSELESKACAELHAPLLFLSHALERRLVRGLDVHDLAVGAALGPIACGSLKLASVSNRAIPVSVASRCVGRHGFSPDGNLR